MPSKSCIFLPSYWSNRSQQMKELTCSNHLGSVLQRSQLSEKWETNCNPSYLAWADIVWSSYHIRAIWVRSVSKAWWERFIWPSVSTGSVNISIGAEQPDSSIPLQKSRHFYCAVQLILNQTTLGSDKSHWFLYIGYKGSHGWPAQLETPISLGELHVSSLLHPHQHKLVTFGKKTALTAWATDAATVVIAPGCQRGSIIDAPYSANLWFCSDNLL